MREQREYRYGLAGNDCTKRREAGCVDGTDNDNDANNYDESDDKNKDKDRDKGKNKNEERDRDRDRDRNKDKSKWLTSKGFQYPALKTKKEEMTHPKRPSESTIENLRKPWYDTFLPLITFFLSTFLPFFFLPHAVLFFRSIFLILLYLLFLSCLHSISFFSPSPSPSPYPSPLFVTLLLLSLDLTPYHTLPSRLHLGTPPHSTSHSPFSST
jgi:hypothetical protein